MGESELASIADSEGNPDGRAFLDSRGCVGVRTRFAYLAALNLSGNDNTMATQIEKTSSRRAGTGSLHMLGVLCGVTAGVWLGAAEAPTKLVNAGFSPFAISLCMVAGVFTARWSFPTLLKGTAYVFADLMSRKHLLVWAILAGALWAVANTLTVFAIRDVGLAIAFPMWNTNALVGLFWGRVLFRELDGADTAALGVPGRGVGCGRRGRFAPPRGASAAGVA